MSEDETDYLLCSPANADELRAAVAELGTGCMDEVCAVALAALDADPAALAEYRAEVMQLAEGDPQVVLTRDISSGRPTIPQ
jgi:hypothetical protein